MSYVVKWQEYCLVADALRTRTEDLRKGRQFELKLPGLLVIDTPGDLRCRLWRLSAEGMLFLCTLQGACRWLGLGTDHSCTPWHG